MPSRKRRLIANFRLKESEKVLLKRAAVLCGMSFSDYVRSISLADAMRLTGAKK